MASAQPMFLRRQGFYLPPGEQEIKLACAKQYGVRHGPREKSDLGMTGLEKRLAAMRAWLRNPPKPGDPA
jgi:hypothetical protein